MSASASSGFSMSSSWRSLADTVLAGWPIDYDLLEPDVPAISEADIAKRMCGLPFKPVDDVTRPTPAETVRNLSRPDPESGRLMQLPAIPSAESARSMKRQRRAERLRTAGKNWFGLPRQETDEAQAQALEVLQMRRLWTRRLSINATIGTSPLATIRLALSKIGPRIITAPGQRASSVGRMLWMNF
ncbi:hypothetical protein BOX15_Mlig017970g1 [Macrostomum lignano]|uniref:Uncharacterized protein n=1 Tax=Macrostomum lignano TaxID=282301 RepID=A0A267FAC7_9PLAT|nr:hypothetical protein BOX15_Mlig017970g1 [Macrostomum lignano]